jgi:hypothetical protein
LIFCGVKLKIKLFFILLAVGFVSGCTKISVYNPNNYRVDVIAYESLPELDPNFILCQELFASKFDVQYEANLVCATKGKEARLVKRQIFNSCYFLQPISNVYECV